MIWHYRNDGENVLFYSLKNRKTFEAYDYRTISQIIIKKMDVF